VIGLLHILQVWKSCHLQVIFWTAFDCELALMKI
jgi:hypothetical protein